MCVAKVAIICGILFIYLFIIKVDSVLVPLQDKPPALVVGSSQSPMNLVSSDIISIWEWLENLDRVRNFTYFFLNLCFGVSIF